MNWDSSMHSARGSVFSVLFFYQDVTQFQNNGPHNSSGRFQSYKVHMDYLSSGP